MQTTKTVEERRAAMKERRAKTCKHFNGLQNEICKLGIRYDTVNDFPPELADEPPFFRETHFCFAYQKCSTVCAKREFYTAEELEARDKESHERLRQFSEDYKNNICPNHKTPMTKTQIGRCIYAMPCGCRLGQGKLRGA
jgi:hypothetical protein